jgi:uncharacterized protein (TIGR03437 family)
MDQLVAALGGTLPPPSPTPTATPTPTPVPTPYPTPNPSPSPTPGPGQSGETVWVSGALPAGATGYGDTDGWNWSNNNPQPYLAPLTHQSIVSAGVHQHYFANASATLTLNTGETLCTYVYLDPINPPSEILLQWSTKGLEFDHRAYWGASNIPWGTAGTESLRYMGPLPAVGQWVRLEVPASQVGLEGKTVTGMAFTLYGGKASWDRSGKNAGNVFRIMTSSEDGTGQAIAMNLTKQTSYFDVTTPENLGADKRTRVSLFGIGITATAANSDTSNDLQVGNSLIPNFAETVAVEARLGNGQLISLPVEFVGTHPGMIGLDQLTVRLTPELRGAGTVALTVIISGQRSNSGTIFIQ